MNIAPIVLSLLARFTRPDKATSDDIQVVRYGAPMRIASIIAAMISMWIAFACYMAITTEGAPHYYYLGTFFFAVAALYLVTAVFTFKIVINDANVELSSFWRVKLISWDAVISCECDSSKTYYLIDAGCHGKIEINNFMDGISPFINRLMTRVTLKIDGEG